MELIQMLKIKYYQGDNTMNVNATELKRLNYLLGQGYFAVSYTHLRAHETS